MQDFHIETSTDGTHWTLQANVTGNTAIVPVVQFPAATTFTSMRLTVTKNSNLGWGVYTRIAEVVLGDFIGDSAWPAGTSVSASTAHAPGDQPSYAATNAIDNNPATWWNDVGQVPLRSQRLSHFATQDTEGQYPDVLTIASGEVVVLPGITILSHSDGTCASDRLTG